MDLRILVFVVLGIFVGSLVNVLIYRLPRREKWVGGRSRCVFCKHTLAWCDLIPVASFVLLGGKCRYCNKPISILYPIVELVNGFLWGCVGYLGNVGFVLSGLGKLGWSGWGVVSLVLALILGSTLLVILVVDLQHYIIPDEMVVVMVVVGLVLGLSGVLSHPGGVIQIDNELRYHTPGVLNAVRYDTSEVFIEARYDTPGVLNRLVWGAGAMGFFLALHYITKGKGMGWGDVKLALGMGLILGKAVLVALMSAFMLGAVVGVMLLGLKLKKLRQPIPFGPFLVMGMGVGLVYGEQVLEWYLIGILN